MITEAIIKKESHQYDCKVVQRIRLEGKGILVMSNLENFGGILELSLARNEISRIEGLDSLITLQKLDLSHNRISKISNMSQLLCLRVFNLSGNNISSFECLRELSMLPELQSLKLKGFEDSESNPVCESTIYFKTVMRILPDLAVLDGGSVEVLRSFQYVMEKSPADQLVLPPLRPDRWFLAEDLRVESHVRGRNGSKSAAQPLLESDVFADDNISRLVNIIEEKLKVDCARVLSEGDTALLRYHSAK